MKKIAAILSLVLIIAMLMSPVCYASGLEIVGTTPKDGGKGYQPQNMAVKIKFNEEMLEAGNASHFSVTSADGRGVPFQLVCSEEKYPNELWLVISETLMPDTEYRVNIASGVKSKAGNVLSGNQTTSFRTRNTKTDSKISMVLMLGMMGFMFIASARAAKNQEAEAAAPVKKNDPNLNPYKISKERGISLEEAKAIVEKEKAKQAKAQEKYEREKARRDEAMAAEMEEMQKRLEEEAEAARRANNFHVKAPASIVEKGYKVPRSVVKKNKAKRDAARKAEKKAAQGKKK